MIIFSDISLLFLNFTHNPRIIEDYQATNGKQKEGASTYCQEFDEDDDSTPYHLEYDELIGQMEDGTLMPFTSHNVSTVPLTLS